MYTSCYYLHISYVGNCKKERFNYLFHNIIILKQKTHHDGQSFSVINPTETTLKVLVMTTINTILHPDFQPLLHCSILHLLKIQPKETSNMFLT